jgi:hypothetical protein
LGEGNCAGAAAHLPRAAGFADSLCGWARTCFVVLRDRGGGGAVPSRPSLKCAHRHRDRHILLGAVHPHHGFFRGILLSALCIPSFAPTVEFSSIIMKIPI